MWKCKKKKVSEWTIFSTYIDEKEIFLLFCRCSIFVFVSKWSIDLNYVKAKFREKQHDFDVDLCENVQIGLKMIGCRWSSVSSFDLFTSSHLLQTFNLFSFLYLTFGSSSLDQWKRKVKKSTMMKSKKYRIIDKNW